MIDLNDAEQFLDQFGIMQKSIGSTSMFAFRMRGYVVAVYPNGDWRIRISEPQSQLSGSGIDSLKRCVTAIEVERGKAT